MFECCDNPIHICQFPTELLIYIFQLLSAKSFISCRQVCSRWKAVIDFMSNDDDLWEKYCKQDYSELYIDARKKSNSCRLWSDIYQSLTLWGRLSDATEVTDVFCESSGSADEIQDLVILKNGTMAVRKRSAVVYYDISTLEMTERDPVYGDFTRFIEYDDAMIILGSHLHLRIIKKPKPRRHKLRKSSSKSDIRPDEEKIFYNTKYFLTVGRDVYFVNFNNDIFHCNIDKGLTATKLPRDYEDSVGTLSFYNGHLNILTQHCDVLSYQNNKFVKLFNLGSKKNVFDCLWKYKFIETLHWSMFYLWAASFQTKVPEGPLKNISKVRVYGDTFFVGCRNGVVVVYYKPFVNGHLDLFTHMPVKKYDFANEVSSKLSLNPILSFDVIEIKGGHKLLVPMPKKVIVITYIHNFVSNKSKAVVKKNLK